MVNVQELEKLIEDFMLGDDATMRDLKPYLISEYNFKEEPGKNYRFEIRLKPIPEDVKLSEYLKSYMPTEVLVHRQVEFWEV